MESGFTVGSSMLCSKRFSIVADPKVKRSPLVVGGFSVVCY